MKSCCDSLTVLRRASIMVCFINRIMMKSSTEIESCMSPILSSLHNWKNAMQMNLIAEFTIIPN